jgi:hypothetical protein
MIPKGKKEQKKKKESQGVHTIGKQAKNDDKRVNI